MDIQAEGVFLCKRSANSFGSAWFRRLPLRLRSSQVFMMVSVIMSWVFSEPPTMEKSSARVNRLCPSVLSSPMPNRCALCSFRI